jgi:hypothetical protein
LIDRWRLHIVPRPGLILAAAQIVAQSLCATTFAQRGLACTP